MATLPNALLEIRETNLPVRFRVESETVEFVGHTTGLLREHILMSTHYQLTDGVRLALRMAVPLHVSSAGEFRFTGQVLWGSRLPNGLFCYHVQIKNAFQG